MAMKANEVRSALVEAFPEAEVVLEALINDGDHYKVTVTSNAFQGLSRIQQHQMVYQALGEKMGTQLHALSVVTKCPSMEN